MAGEDQFLSGVMGVHPPLVANHWIGGGVDHGMIVDGRKVPIDQLKLVLPKQDRPD